MPRPLTHRNHDSSVMFQSTVFVVIYYVAITKLIYFFPQIEKCGKGTPGRRTKAI
jgi:hypothetical protein